MKIVVSLDDSTEWVQVSFHTELSYILIMVIRQSPFLDRYCLADLFIDVIYGWIYVLNLYHN